MLCSGLGGDPIQPCDPQAGRWEVVASSLCHRTDICLAENTESGRGSWDKCRGARAQQRSWGMASRLRTLWLVEA